MQIKQDLKLTLSFTIILILLILIVVFRSYFLPVLFVLPAVFGMIFSLALIYWFRGDISGIALGSGAIVFGIVIDYSFHFFSHQKHNKDNSKTIKELYILTEFFLLTIDFQPNQKFVVGFQNS